LSGLPVALRSLMKSLSKKKDIIGIPTEIGVTFYVYQSKFARNVWISLMKRVSSESVSRGRQIYLYYNYRQDITPV
jgi:hypothetical protein